MRRVSEPASLAVTGDRSLETEQQHHFPPKKRVGAKGNSRWPMVTGIIKVRYPRLKASYRRHCRRGALTPARPSAINAPAKNTGPN